MNALELIQLLLLVGSEIAKVTRNTADEKIVSESLAGLQGLQEAINEPLTRERLMAKRFTPEW